MTNVINKTQGDIEKFPKEENDKITIMTELPIQNSPPYNRYGPYQCSWFASGCVANKEKLIHSWLHNPNQFREEYTRILEEATHLRGTTNPEEIIIHTLFYPPIFNYYNLEVTKWCQYQLNRELPDLLTQNHALYRTNAVEIKETKLKFPEQSFDELRIELTQMFEKNHSFLAHRNGQAFCALPLSPLEFLLLDDHYPIARLVCVDELINYVKNVPENLYCIFFWSTSARKRDVTKEKLE